MPVRLRRRELWPRNFLADDGIVSALGGDFPLSSSQCRPETPAACGTNSRGSLLFRLGPIVVLYANDRGRVAATLAAEGRVSDEGAPADSERRSKRPGKV